MGQWAIIFKNEIIKFNVDMINFYRLKSVEASKEVTRHTNKLFQHAYFYHLKHMTMVKLAIIYENESESLWD